MADPFVEKPVTAVDDNGDDDLVQLMSRVDETTTGNDSTSAAEQVRQTLSSKRVCPFCGHQTTHGNEPCPRCTMEDSPATRQATKTRIGPWYVLQSRNPAAPGMKYATLLALINKGHVTPRSIVRGPTTHQMWRYAAHVRGISREFGLCFSCGGAIDRGSAICQHCQRSQDAPSDPDVLIETKAVAPQAAPQPPQAAQEQFSEPAPSYAQRMRDLNRQRTFADIDQRTDPSQPATNAARRTEVIKRQTDGRIVSAMELAAALQNDPDAALQGPRWRMMRVAAAILLVLVLAGGGMLAVMPEYRQSTFAWVGDTVDSIKSKWSSVQWQGNKSEPQVAVAKENPAPVQPPVAMAPQEPAPTPPVAPAVIAAPPKEVVENVVIAPPTAATPAGSTEQIQIQRPPVTAAPAVSDEITVSNAPDRLELIRSLRSKAIDAAADGKYTTAVKLFEEIEKYPKVDWPGDLQGRLKAAREMAAQSSSTE